MYWNGETEKNKRRKGKEYGVNPIPACRYIRKDEESTIVFKCYLLE